MICGFVSLQPTGFAMTEIMSEPQEHQAEATAQQAPIAAPTTVEPVSQPDANAADATEVQASQEDSSTPRRSRRGGRGRKSPGVAASAAETAPPSGQAAQRPARQPHPLLAQLAQWYPAMFGEELLPLKRGVYEDLLAAHAELDKEALKLALQQHTRSGRYLAAMASGKPRHDLSGQPVEATLPEHVHHALIEVFRRRQQRSAEDLQPKLLNRIIIAFEASGLSREDYALRVQGRDEATNALVAQALTEAEARAAKDEALLRSFTLSGQTSEAEFAEMYGMNPRYVAQQLDRARRRQQAAA